MLELGALSREAAQMTVSIRFSMTADGMPDTASFRLVDQSSASHAAAQNAFDLGRRAVIECAGAGYDLPLDKYNRWRDIIVDFGPDGPGGM